MGIIFICVLIFEIAFTLIFLFSFMYDRSFLLKSMHNFMLSWSVVEKLSMHVRMTEALEFGEENCSKGSMNRGN